MPSFNPQSDIPDLSKKICVVTGGNSGLGEATMIALAQHNPEKLYLAARSRSKAEESISRIKSTSTTAQNANIAFLELDLASLNSVKKAAEQLSSEVSHLDLVYLNGGIAAAPAALTKDGYEMHFGVNYLGHALFVQMLMPKLLQTAAMPGADVRIVSVSSTMHKGFAPKEGIIFNGLKTKQEHMPGAPRYAQSMLAKNLFARGFAKKYPHIKHLAVHPGLVKSAAYDGSHDMNWIGFKLLLIAVALTGVTTENGAKGQLWCGFSKNVINGAYYEPIGKAGKEGPLSLDDMLESTLWNWTEEELRAHGGPGWPQNKVVGHLV